MHQMISYRMERQKLSNEQILFSQEQRIRQQMRCQSSEKTEIPIVPLWRQPATSRMKVGWLAEKGGYSENVCAAANEYT